MAISKSNAQEHLESLSHQTSFRPFSSYHTILNLHEINALYLHWHPEAEFFFLEKGQLNFQIESKNYVLRQGEGIFIPPNLIHRAENLTAHKAPCSYRAFVFSPDWLKKNLPPDCEIYFNALHTQQMHCTYHIQANPLNQRLLSLLPDLFIDVSGPRSQWELALMGTLLSCWQELYNLCFQELTFQQKISHTSESLDDWLMYIQDHCTESLKLKDVAGTFGFSEGYFCHIFKERTGYKLFEYLNRIRIMKSCELLKTTSKKITEIASLCGFDNISYYNRRFVRMMGLTPSQYRKSSGDMSR